MSNEVINQSPSVERAKELEQQAKEGLNQMKLGQDIAILACHKMRDTKAYKALGFDSYYAWGESALNLKKSRLNELALAGEVQQELLSGVESNVKPFITADITERNKVNEPQAASAEPVDFEGEDEDGNDINAASDDQVITAPQSKVSVADLSEMGTPQLLALAKAPRGERLAILDKVVVEAKAEDKQITTSIIKEVVKASAEPVEESEPSVDEKAIVIKKQHKSAMSKVSKLTEELNELDISQVDKEEVESWKTYLDEVKLSISTLEKQLGY